MAKLFVLLLLGLLVNDCASYKSDLMFVIAISRHGMRAPSGTYKNDPYKHSKPWGVPYGQLTNFGKMQQYNLGKWFRKRYDGFLPKRYSKYDFKIFATDMDRCLESAAACAAGIYPPDESEMLDRTIRWQPVPIHSSKDTLIYHKTTCPKHVLLMKDLYDCEVSQKLLKENEKFLKYVSEMSGEKITNFRELRLLFGIIYVQSFFNVTLPDWAQDSFEKMHCLSKMEIISHTYNTQLGRLRSGPLIDSMLTYFQSATSGAANSLKFVLYTAHEGTLINVMNTMGIYDYHWPEFSESLLLELRKDPDKYFVNMLYKNSTNLSKLSLKDCAFSCELGRYTELLKPVRLNMDDWEHECGSS